MNLWRRIMAENRTLLSQDEIDALVSFLQNQQSDNSEAVSIGDVLDQSSIDKLVDIIRFNNNHGIFLNADTTAAALSAGNVDIIGPDGNAISKENCELICKLADNGMAELYCSDKNSSALYRIAPESLSQRKHVSEGKAWGRAVSPRHFNKVANLFRLDYSQDTYKAVCDRFAEVMYGGSGSDVAKMYFPIEG